MLEFTRRRLLKIGAAVSAELLTRSDEPALAASVTLPRAPLIEAAALDQPTSLRQRLLLDFDSRFHLGHASDQSLDFGYGAPSREGSFAKASFVAEVGKLDFDDSSWRLLDLPHDWAVELPFISGKKTYAEGDEQKLVNFGEGRKPHWA